MVEKWLKSVASHGKFMEESASLPLHLNPKIHRANQTKTISVEKEFMGENFGTSNKGVGQWANQGLLTIADAWDEGRNALSPGKLLKLGSDS